MNFKTLLFYLILIICCHNNLKGQTYPYKIFNTSDGLINNRCGNISQDSAGYIWVSGDNGVSNYDGRKFNFFPGPNLTYYFAHTNTVNMYKGHCIYGSHGQGVLKCLGNKVTFNYPKNEKPENIESGIYLNDSTYVVAKLTTKHIEVIVGNTITKYIAPSSLLNNMHGFLCILLDNANNIWVGTDVGVFVYKNYDFNNPIVIPTLLNKYCNVLSKDFEGNVFISASSSVYKFDVASFNNLGSLVPIKFCSQSQAITALGYFRNGDILVSNYPSGLFIYNKNLNLTQTISGNGFPEVVIWDIFVDREENIWLATENGLFRFNNFNFTNFVPPIANGWPVIRSGVAYKDAFVFNNGKAINIIKNNQLSVIDKNATGYSTKIIVTPENKLWVNNYYNDSPNEIIETDEVELVNNNFIKTKSIIKAQTSANVLNMDMMVGLNEKDLLFYNNQLSIYNNNKVHAVKLPKQLDSVNFATLGKGINNNEFIIASKNATLFYCNITNTNNIFYANVLQSIPLSYNYSNARFAKTVVLKNNNLWVATKNKGVLVYTFGDGVFAFKKCFSSPIISSELVTDILEDSNGDIWVGGNNGVDKLSPVPNGDYTIAKSVYESQMTGKYIFFIKEFENKIYLGTTGSLACIPLNIALNNSVPNVYINHILINNKPADSLLNNQTTSLNYNENNLAFEFVAPTFINEKQTLYQYILEGVDKDWSEPTINYEIRYNQLPPGKYTFKVRAKNANNIWTVKDAQFAFVIKAPFYKHWLFLAALFLLFAALLYWLYKQKMNKVIAVERTRKSISKDLHDDIGSTLSSITLMNAVLKHKIEDHPQAAIKMAEKIETTSRQMLQNMNDIVWSINPNNDTMEKLIYRLQEFCNSVFDENKTHFNLTSDEAINKKSIAMQLRRDIFLTCKEIINNTAKYSEAKNFSLKLSYNNKTIIIIAADDGIGFDNKQVNKGNGINNIKNRINSHKGKLELTSHNGVVWHISLPT